MWHMELLYGYFSFRHIYNTREVTSDHHTMNKGALDGMAIRELSGGCLLVDSTRQQLLLFSQRWMGVTDHSRERQDTPLKSDGDGSGPRFDT